MARTTNLRVTASVFLTLAFGLLFAMLLDLKTFLAYGRTLVRPETLLAVLLYAGAFHVRAFAWGKADENQGRHAHYVASLYTGLAINHLFPVKLGETVRFLTGRLLGSPAKRTMAILAAQRGVDLVVLGGLVAFGLVASSSVVSLVALLSGLVVIVFVRRYVKSLLVLSSLIAWLLEGLAVWCLLIGAGVPLSFANVLVAMSAGVLSGIFQFTPGGFGTYELAMGAVLKAYGVPDAFEIALMTHAFKYVFAYGAFCYVFVRHPKWMRSLLSLFRRRGAERM